MGYLGTPIDTNNTFQSLQGKRFSGNGSTTAFTLDVAPTSTLDIEVFVENVRQDPNSAYTVSGTTLTFSAAPDAGTNNIYVVHQAKAVATISAGAGTVNAASMDNTVISGHDALTSRPADTDEFLVSDAGTIKRVDFSHIKGSIGQIVQTVKTDTASVASAATNNFADLPGMSVAITPTATSSKILVSFTVSVGTSAGTLHINLVRGSTNIAVGGASSSRLASTISHRPAATPYNLESAPLSYTYLDSPNTVSETTYKLQGSLGSDYNATYYINRTASDSDYSFGSRVTSTITVMEVLA